jgi:hypothetical protein
MAKKQLLKTYKTHQRMQHGFGQLTLSIGVGWIYSRASNESLLSISITKNVCLLFGS